MEIAFNREDVRNKLVQNMHVAMQYGFTDTAGSIAAVIASTFNAFDRIDAGEPSGLVKEEMCERHQMIANYFFERERETLVIEQRRLDSMTLEEFGIGR